MNAARELPPGPDGSVPPTDARTSTITSVPRVYPPYNTQGTTTNGESDSQDTWLDSRYQIVKKSCIQSTTPTHSKSIVHMFKGLSSSIQTKYLTVPVASDLEVNALERNEAWSKSLPDSRTKKADIGRPSLSLIPEVVIHEPGTSAPIDGQPREIPTLSGKTRQFRQYNGKHAEKSLMLSVDVVNAVNLSKIDKFGTQSSFLELRICDASHLLTKTTSCASNTLVLQSHTETYKKGGSDAIWNEHFYLAIESKQEQSLHIAVKTSNKSLVGEAHIALYHTSSEVLEDWFCVYAPTSDLSQGRESGRVRLRLKLVDSPSDVTSSLSPRVESLLETSASRIPLALSRGSLFHKVAYHQRFVKMLGSSSSSSSASFTAPKRQWIMVEELNSKCKEAAISWARPQGSGPNRFLRLSQVQEIRAGHQTPPFERLIKQSKNAMLLSTASNGAAAATMAMLEQDRCFSVVTSSRSLDVIASSKEEAHTWVVQLRLLISIKYEAQIQTPATQKSPMNKTSMLRAFMLDPVIKDKSTSRIDLPRKSYRSVDILRLAKDHEWDQLDQIFKNGYPIDKVVEKQNGDTPLLLACRIGDLRLVEICLAHHAKNDPHPDFGDTAVQLAVRNGHGQCLSRVLATAASSLLDQEVVNHMDSNNDSPLHVAARRGDLDCIQILCHHGADVAVLDANGRTPIHCTIFGNHCECAAYLVDVGSDAILNEPDITTGNTPLHDAARLGYSRLVKLLLQSAAEVAAFNHLQKTPYELALGHNHVKCAKFIAKYHTKAHSNRTTREAQPRTWTGSNGFQLRTEAQLFSNMQSMSPRNQVRRALAENPSLRDTLARQHVSQPWQSARDYSSLERRQASGLGSQSERIIRADCDSISAVHPVSPSAFRSHSRQVLTAPKVQQHSPFQKAKDVWQTYYTSEGHCYYVHGITGESQWESPYPTEGQARLEKPRRKVDQ
uniref:Uncharacterized protein AlNc14C65G4630 n=1 Tax=Albugo laibachii Nc14 TaxID=890382 RepID=F0WDB0_9STRA|nr:conserved hypothetical protein [Albugo laibachii Nc14]|eukprot:CCA19182.1 conserved hypothetical protein [Albugo laibachii Nc14]